MSSGDYTAREPRVKARICPSRGTIEQLDGSARAFFEARFFDRTFGETAGTGLIGDVLEAYERLILDAMRGDRTLFTTAEGIERLWQMSIPLLESPLPVRLYQPGSWGPKSIHQLD